VDLAGPAAGDLQWPRLDEAVRPATEADLEVRRLPIVPADP
jgi:hypothetical protein